MSQGKAMGWSGRGAPVEDPEQLRLAMQELLDEEVEFPIKVEGTHTLPYTAKLVRLDAEKGLLHLKLIRPLPHELALGAIFNMLFPASEQRFEALCTYVGREGHLLYRFTQPARMVSSDRRRHKRYPFRPREKAYVIAQDGAIPGHGLSGPLMNLSLGGLAFRVDRIMRLDEHLRVTPSLGFFERGKSLPVLKIRDLPNLPLFEARGIVANAWEREGEIIANIQFGDLGEAERRELEAVLSLRELMQRGTQLAPAGEGSKPASPRAAGAPDGPAARMDPAGRQAPDALRRLGRRCARVVLAMHPGPERDQVGQALGGAGFLRIIVSDTLDHALARLQEDRSDAFPLLIVDGQTAGPGAAKAIRSLQRTLGPARDLSVALIQQAPEPAITEEANLRLLPWPGTDPAPWLPILDELAGVG